MKKVITIMGLVGLIFVQAQVGINTDTPQATLDIKSEVNTLKALKITNSANTEIVTVTDDGKMGIGTANPQVKLEVNGEVSVGLRKIASATTPELQDYGARLYFNGLVNNTDPLFIARYNRLSDKTELRVNIGDNEGGDDKFVIGTHLGNLSWNPFFTVVNNGRVGVGTTGPTAKLDVAGNARIRELVAGNIADEVVTVDNNGNLGKVSREVASINLFKSNGTLTANRTVNQNGKNLLFTGAGNVGIGTTAPKGKLHVEGDIISSVSSDTGGYLTLGNPSKTGANARYWRIYNMTGVYGNYLSFWSYSADGSQRLPRLQITDAGNVGIGTTAPTEKLHVIGNIKASGTITPDYVFQKYYDGHSSLKADYQMMSLSEVEAFTRKHKHLPGVPSAAEVKKSGGILVNRATEINLEKIEELYLHTIEQEKKIEEQQGEINELKTLVNQLIHQKNK